MCVRERKKERERERDRVNQCKEEEKRTKRNHKTKLLFLLKVPVTALYALEGSCKRKNVMTTLK